VSAHFVEIVGNPTKKRPETATAYTDGRCAQLNKTATIDRL